jgi:hypothetical protein
MKKVNVLFLGVLIFFAGFLGSCTKEDDPSGPQITFSNSLTETTLAAGVTSWEINATITSVAGLSNVKIFNVTNAGETQLTSISSFSDKTNYHLTFTVSDIAAQTTIKVSATDKNDVTNSMNFVIKVTALATKTGKIYHIQAATGKGAWDLVADVAKASTDAAADKDMINASENVSGSTFVAGWNVGSGNSTMFVKANTYDFTNASLATAKTTYAAGTPSNQIRSVANNDIYIAKLRGQDTYAIIKITNVNPDDATATSGSNKGVIEFSYKK